VQNNEPSDKVIRDVVHGYISLNKLDLQIIDTPYFQRLKRIEQTAASSVYPCANHTRFEHSLGVMFLGTKIFDTIITQENLKKFESYRNTVRYACLMHDIGHAPFSHIGESFYDKEEIIERLNTLYSKYEITEVPTGKGAAPHELFSCAIALEGYNDFFKKNDIDPNLFCRMIMGEEYVSEAEKEKNCLIKILNSPIDADKLDYMLRDSFMTGAQLVNLDVNRLISSYLIDNGKLILSSKSLSTISNFIYGRDALYQWIYNHHVTVYVDYLIKDLISQSIINKENRDRFFSFNAIFNNLIDDNHIITEIRNQCESNQPLKENYLKYLNRQFLKPIWKNIHEFRDLFPNEIVHENIIFCYKTNTQEEFQKKLQRINNKLESCDIVLTMAQFKPYNPLSPSPIYIKLKNNAKVFHKIFQHSTYKDEFPELPYIYSNPEKHSEIIKALNELPNC
jgi:uncharacterized protein